MTVNWYATTGGAGLPFTRCNGCFEDEVRQASREALPMDVLRKMETDATIYNEDPDGTIPS